MGQTPLVCAPMQGHDKVVSRLLASDQVDARRLTIDFKSALSVAATPECGFLLRMLTSDEEEEEARRRAEQTQARVTMMMLRWTKAAMVGAYYKWNDFALVPENKINRLGANFLYFPPSMCSHCHILSISDGSQEMGAEARQDGMFR